MSDGNRFAHLTDAELDAAIQERRTEQALIQGQLDYCNYVLHDLLFERDRRTIDRFWEARSGLRLARWDNLAVTQELNGNDRAFSWLFREFADSPALMVMRIWDINPETAEVVMMHSVGGSLHHVPLETARAMREAYLAREGITT